MFAVVDNPQSTLHLQSHLEDIRRTILLAIMSHYDLAIMNSAIRMAHGSLIRILHHSRIANKLGATAVQLPHEEVNKSRGHKELLHKVHPELRITIWNR